jgi:hypothetical protein
MSKKDSNFFEKHIEKIVLAIVGLGCLWLFIARVLFSPDYIEYDGQKVDPRTIDNLISKQAEALENKYNRKPEPKPPYQPKVNDFIARFDSAISDINTSFALPQPIISSKEIVDDRAYHIPLISEINEVLAEHIRAVAYVPKVEITEKNAYGSDNSEPSDIDFVTVEAKVDVSGLYKRFKASFAGEDIPQGWRDPCLARPVFASVQLQRQKLLSDGSWSDWQTVPRSRVDPRRRMFEVIEDINDLPAGGIKVRLLQFNDAEVRMDLLQPKAYQIASAKEEWFPPSLHGKYVERQKEVDVLKRREVAAEKKGEREGERSERRGKQTAASAAKIRPTTEGTGGPGGAEGMEGEKPSERAPSTSATARKSLPAKVSQPDRKTEKEHPQKAKEVSKTTDDVHQEFEGILITEKTDLARLDKPLLFWAYDDTVEPGKYRYRIRLGVFNPIAGTNQFTEQDKSLKNKVILWSEFSNTTETVDIPEKLYFFPHEREIQEATKTITVKVSKYVLGYWYSKDFMVKPGELIGKVGEYKMTEEEEKAGVKAPQMVDYTTSAVVVDIVPVTDWSGGNNLHVNHFCDLLYSYNGKDIECLPIKSNHWTEALQNKFKEIQKYEKEPKEPLRVWEGKATGGAQRRSGSPKIGEEGLPTD